jgi:hypothetical protein
MSLGLMFWILMLVALVFGFYTNRASVAPYVSSSLPAFILLFLLGWQVFGAPLHS